MAVLVGAVVATSVDGPVPVRIALWGLTALAVGQRLVGAGRRSTVEGVLRATGGTLVALVLVGLGLALSGVPLTPVTWAVSLGALGLLALVLTGGSRPGPRPPREAASAPGAAVATGIWVLTTLVLTGAAVAVAVGSARDSDLQPVEMSVGAVDGVNAEVVVSSGGPVGPFEIRTDAGGGSVLSYPAVSVPDDGQVTTQVLLPPEGRVVISLHNPGQAEPLRSLVVDR